MASSQKYLNVAYMNIRGQTALDIAKQVQIEQFIKFYKIDILHCQEINILEDSFEHCDFINSSYYIVANNASNKYGTCSFISNSFEAENIKLDTNGRVITFDIGNITLCNVYLPSGNDQFKRSSRENYSAEIIPQLLLNRKDIGFIGGDWNSITHEIDATKNTAQKMSPSLKRLITTFSWTDSFRYLHSKSQTFSRYYEHNKFGEGATRLDRQYHWGNVTVVEASYAGVAFSDHQVHIVKIQLPEINARILSLKSNQRKNV